MLLWITRRAAVQSFLLGSGLQENKSVRSGRGFRLLGSLFRSCATPAASSSSEEQVEVNASKSGLVLIASHLGKA